MNRGRESGGSGSGGSESAGPWAEVLGLEGLGLKVHGERGEGFLDGGSGGSVRSGSEGLGLQLFLSLFRRVISGCELFAYFRRSNRRLCACAHARV